MTYPASLTDRRDPDISASADTPDTALFTDLLASACRDGDPMRQALQVARIKHFIAARAWTDAALALIALQAPRWKLRGLIYDGGEWHCTLSRQRDMPDWLDDTVEAHHANMALAIVAALGGIADKAPRLHVVATSASSESFEPMVCDNFA